MKNKWIWIVGIILGLLIVTVAFAMPFVHNALVGQTGAFGYGQGFQRPMMDGTFGYAQGYQRPMMDGVFGHRGMMVYGYQNFGSARSLPFAFGFMFFRLIFWIIPWLVFGLILWGVYQWGKNSGARSASTVKTVEVVSTPEQSSEGENK